MKFHLFLVSFSYLYAKYNYYCYEVAKSQPMIYFDGEVWKTVQPSRAPNGPLGLRRPNITIDLDLDESLSFETVNNILPRSEKIAAISKKTTTKILTKVTKKVVNIIKKITSKTTKKSITKAIKTATNKKTIAPCANNCNYLKNSSVTKRTLPTVNAFAITQNKNKRTTKKPPAKTTKKVATKTTKKVVTKTTKKVTPKTTKKIVTKTTKKPQVHLSQIRNYKSIKKPIATPTSKPTTKTTTAVPEKWMLMMKDLASSLKAIEAKQSTPYCEEEPPHYPCPEYLLSDGRKAMNRMTDLNGLEDLATILVDGVEVDQSDDTNRDVVDERFDFEPKNSPDVPLSYAEIEALVAPKLTHSNEGRYLLRNVKNEESSKDKYFHINSDTINHKLGSQNVDLVTYLDTLNETFATKDKETSKIPHEDLHFHLTKDIPVIKKHLQKRHKSFFETIKEKYEAENRAFLKNASIILNHARMRAKEETKDKDIEKLKKILNLDAIKAKEETIEKDVSQDHVVILDLDGEETSDVPVDNVENTAGDTETTKYENAAEEHPIDVEYNNHIETMDHDEEADDKEAVENNDVTENPVTTEDKEVPKNEDTTEDINSVLDNDATETALDNDATETALDNDATETIFDNDATETALVNEATETALDNDATETALDNDATETALDNEATETELHNEATETAVENDVTESVVHNDATGNTFIFALDDKLNEGTYEEKRSDAFRNFRTPNSRRLRSQLVRRRNIRRLKNASDHTILIGLEKGMLTWA